MQRDYYESDNYEVVPEVYNDQISRKETATISEQIKFLREQTNQLQQSIDLEKVLQVDNPIAYLNAIENNLESMKITNLQQRIQCLAILGSGAEKSVTLRCILPQSDNLKRFQQIEKQVHNLETIVGSKPYDYNSTLMKDLNEIQTLIQSVKGDVKLGANIPTIDKVNEVYRQVQLLVGVVDLLPNIVTRLEELKQAHEQSIQYQNQLKELQVKHGKILNLLDTNSKRIKGLCEKIQKRLQ